MVEIALRSLVDPLDLEAIFGRRAPLEIDLGCGDGAFLAARALESPERNFLGIERLLGRVRRTAQKADHRELRNVRVLRVEIGYAVRYLVPPACAKVVYLLFPDPWPKTRHHRRRLVTAEFLQVVRGALKLGGIFHLATDDSAYFYAIAPLAAVSPGFEMLTHAPREQLPQTTFEKRFAAAGAPIYRLSLQKVSG